MCGIAGHVGPTARELLPAMLGLLTHRGPDDSGIHSAADVGLGMTRLAIIDLVTGQQPMSDATGRYWIVFNGEIYNFRQLRAELEAGGRRFRTRSDTEVILHAYAAYGEACVERLSGMFAFAIWDDAERRLFLARDRLGKKPLYYWHRGRLFLFASEPKALLCHPAVSRGLDWPGFYPSLAFGSPPAAHPIFDTIRKLPPAHTAALVDGGLTLSRYWQLPPGTAPARPHLRPAESAAAVREWLREAVRLRLESDVPLGVFLSGGIDSSAVVASMREVTSGRIATFSVGFGRAAPSYDELPYARLVAQRFATDHHEEILEPDVRAILPDIVRAFDEPFADSSAIPTYVVAQATARHVTPALAAHLGAGVDELQQRAFATGGHGDSVDGAFRVDLAAYLPDDLLTMADRMSMASSLEVRAPFCDHRLIEESLRLSPRAKMPGGRLKGLLKTAFGGVLPEGVLTHRKQGFMIPLGDWLRRDLRPALDDLLAPDCVRMRGLFDVDTVETMKSEHLTGARTHADRLWTLMMAEQWMREYLDRRGPWSLR